MNAVDLQNLSHRYPARKGVEPRTALDQVSMDIPAGDIFGLLGPNGGGKTTLFKILSTALAPTSGNVSIFGFDLRKKPHEIRKKIGVVFQSPSLDKKLTVRENMEHQGHLYGLSGADLRKKIAQLLDRVRLSDRINDAVETLSGGLQRRAEIAKSLLHQPELLIMDEPSTGLDPGARIDLWDYLSELKKSGITVLVTTHLMEEAEKCSRLAILHQGKVVALGTPDALKKEIGGDVVTVQTQDALGLASRIQERFKLKTMVLNNHVHIEKDNGHEFVPQLVQAFPNEITSIMLGKPTLEDVFIHRTGHTFWSEGSPS